MLVEMRQETARAEKASRIAVRAAYASGIIAAGAPYKARIDRWLWPDVTRNQWTSVAPAKKAIADYKKAVGQPEGLAELMVFYCERAAGFSKQHGQQDGGYFDALVRMFEQALKGSATLPARQRDAMLNRLDAMRRSSHNFGYGVGYALDDLFSKYGQA